METFLGPNYVLEKINVKEAHPTAVGTWGNLGQEGLSKALKNGFAQGESREDISATEIG